MSADVVEVGPAYDPAAITGLLAAAVTAEILALVLQRRQPVGDADP